MELESGIDIADERFFPIEICEMIFEYLDATNVLEASLVNKNWYKVIGGTEKCMEKINLKLMAFNDQVQIFHISTRIYQNIVIKVKPDWDPFYEAFFKKNEKWKHVVVRRGGFKMQTFWNILTTMSPSLEVLKIEDLVIDQLLMPNADSAIFPKLKELKVAFKSCHNPNVESFVRQMLVGSPQLKTFNFDGHGVETVFNESLPENISFKLEDLLVINYEDNWPFPKLPFMVSFLQTQFETLESLAIELLEPGMLEIVFQMPKLKVFKCYQISQDVNVRGIELVRNNSIEEVILNGGEYEEIDEVAIAVLGKLPKLKRLEIGTLDDEIFLVLSATALNLEYLEVLCFGISAHHIMSGNPFPMLKEIIYDRVEEEAPEVMDAETTSNFHSLCKKSFIENYRR